jgi:hypothetical protein
MMLLAAMGSTSFMFALFVLFCWHPGISLDMRIAIAGVCLIIVASLKKGAGKRGAI